MRGRQIAAWATAGALSAGTLFVVAPEASAVLESGQPYRPTVEAAGAPACSGSVPVQGYTANSMTVKLKSEVPSASDRANPDVSVMVRRGWILAGEPVGDWVVLGKGQFPAAVPSSFSGTVSVPASLPAPGGGTTPVLPGDHVQVGVYVNGNWGDGFPNGRWHPVEEGGQVNVYEDSTDELVLSRYNPYWYFDFEVPDCSGEPTTSTPTTVPTTTTPTTVPTTTTPTTVPTTTTPTTVPTSTTQTTSAPAGGGGGTGSGGGTAVAGIQVTPVVFSDVSADEWFAGFVARLAELGIVAGRGDGVFDPGAAVTRAEVSAMIVRALGESPGGSAVFSDVPADAWFAGVVARLAELGVVSGRGDGVFDPGGAVTRAEVSAMIFRALGESPTLGSVVFSDVGADEWFAGFVARLAELGIVSGRGDGVFDPGGAVTRAEVSAMIFRAWKL